MTCITLIWTLNTGRSRGLVRLQGLRLGNGGRLPGEIPGFIFFSTLQVVRFRSTVHNNFLLLLKNGKTLNLQFWSLLW